LNNSAVFPLTDLEKNKASGLSLHCLMTASDASIPPRVVDIQFADSLFCMQIQGCHFSHTHGGRILGCRFPCWHLACRRLCHL